MNWTSKFFLGLDLGQARDYSAIAVVERRVVETGAINYLTWERIAETRLYVRHLERIPLRTPYPDVVDRIVAIIRTPELQGRVSIVMDATGVGAPVKDLLRRARTGTPLIPVTLTGGERVTSSYGVHHVPRQDLLSMLRVVLEQRRIAISNACPAAAGLRAELLRWGNSSSHDDLVFATALALWFATLPELTGVRFNGPIPYAYFPHHL